ncbi:MAG: PilC/PilY family type IV pilus protein [Gammaproteobacteria bacterium]|nr:PilC/PilY family type IV pilus protein [Gammaproteobacteria bacterium]
MVFNRIFLTLATAAVLATSTLSSEIARAHDTDIYVGSAANAPEAMVMFTIDYRANLGSTVCNNGECAKLIADGYMPPLTTITFFDMIRAVMKKVLDPLYGFKLGLIVNHAHNNGCAGPTATACSGGAMVYYGLNSVAQTNDDPNTFDPNDMTVANPVEDRNKIEFFKKLDALPIPQGNLSHTWQGSEIYFELFRYLTGQEIFSLRNGWRDYGTTVTYNLGDANDLDSNGNVTPKWDTNVEACFNGTGKTCNNGKYMYKSPLQLVNATDCAGIYVVNFMFGVNQQEQDANAAISMDKANGGMSTSDALNAVDVSNPNTQFANVLRWLYDVDLADGTFGPATWPDRADNLKGTQNVTSYFLINTPNGNFTNEQISWAEAGGTTRPTALSENPDQLEEDLRAHLSNIISVSTTFVAPSIAVNVYNRAQVQKDLFIAMFEAEKTGKPAWSGNIKKFNLDLDKGLIVDASTPPKNAVSDKDGRISNSALSFWTLPGDLRDPVQGIDEFFAGSDGRFIERGGCGSRIPGYKLTCAGTTCTSTFTPGLTNPAGTATATSNRKVFTDPAGFTNGNATGLRPLEATTSVAAATDIMAAFGVATAGTCDPTETTDTSCNMIKYVRGINDGEKNRNWMFGDPLHSRPLAVNYGAINGRHKLNPDIRIYSGTNAGVLHMIRNTLTTGTATTDAQGNPSYIPDQDGVEGWAYMPMEVMDIIPTLRAGSVADHQYGVDGAPTAVTRDVDGDGNIEPVDGDYVHLFFGLRRGGHAYYALDISDPDNPKMLWRITKNDPDFAELGETWSEPVVTQVLHGGNTTSTPALIFSGGFDPNKDDNTVNHTAAAGGPDSMGRGVFVVDASDGSLIWKAVYGATTGPDSAAKAYYDSRMLHSIPSRVTAVDSDGNGLTDRIYVGDTGGNIWRMDLKSNDQFASGNEWRANLVFNAQNNGDTTTTDRRFFYQPDYVQAKDDSGVPYDAIVIGSGNRAHPTNLITDNYFYVIRDRETLSGTPSITTLNHGSLADITNNCLQNSSCATPPDLSNGWRLKLHCPWQPASEPCGEKVLASAFTVASEIYFTSYQPANGALADTCEPSEGSGFLYTLNLKDGTATQDYDSTTAGLTTSDRYEKLKSGGIPSGVVNIGGKVVRPDLQIQETKLKGGYRSFWLENDGY